MISLDSRGCRLLLTKMTARTGKVYLFTASETECADCFVAIYLLVKSITGLSTSLMSKLAFGRQFFSLQVCR